MDPAQSLGRFFQMPGHSLIEQRCFPGALAWQASRLPKRDGRPDRYIGEQDLDRIKQLYAAQDADAGFLAQLFAASPVGK